MSVQKRVIKWLTGLIAAAIAVGSALSVNAVGLGFSHGYVPFTVSGNDTVYAVREIEDFTVRGSMVVAAEIDGGSLTDGDYYFYIEPIADDDLSRAFVNEHEWLNHLHIWTYEMLQVSFFDKNGGTVSPEASLYFCSKYAGMYNAAFVYEDGKFVQIPAESMVECFKTATPSDSLFVMASYQIWPNNAGGVTSQPVTPISDASDDGDVTDPESSKQTSIIWEDINIDVSNKPKDISHQDDPASSAPESSDSASFVPQSSGDSGKTDGKNSTLPEKSGVISKISSASRPDISAPDGPASTGDSSQNLAVLLIMCLTAAAAMLAAFGKKKS